MKGFSASQKRFQGFTLLEILLVVLIIGIMTVVGANVISSQSPERSIMNAAAAFQAELTYMCDLSVLENRAHGVEWTESGRQWLSYQSGDWVIKEQPVNTGETVPYLQQILLDGVEQILEPEVEELPHVICQSDGSFNPFELRWIPLNDEKVYYSMKSVTPWQISGAWFER